MASDNSNNGSDTRLTSNLNHHHHHHHNHHAHFKEESDNLDAHDSKIIVEPSAENCLSIRLGFLQIKHVYQIRFPIIDDLGEDIVFDTLENLHVKIESANPSEDGNGHDIVLTFRAIKEKLMRESITIQSSSDESKKLTLVLNARVLGKGKGTPALKSGVHLVRIEWDEESDGSDWQGF